ARVDQAVQLAEPDTEALRLVRPGGREQPEHALVEATLGAPAREVASEGGAVEPQARAQRAAGGLIEERFATGQSVPDEVGMPAPSDQEREISVRCRHVCHDVLRSPPSRIARVVTTRRPNTRTPIRDVASPASPPTDGIRSSTMPPSGV